MQADHFNSIWSPPRKRWGIFCLCLILLATAISRAQPMLKIEEPKKSFGHVKKGEVVNLNYIVNNAGDQPLVLETAVVSCDCTSAEFSDAPILPGATSTIVVRFDTKSAYGRQDRLVEVHSNDPKGPQRVRFKGVVDK